MRRSSTVHEVGGTDTRGGDLKKKKITIIKPDFVMKSSNGIFVICILLYIKGAVNFILKSSVQGVAQWCGG